MTLEEIFDIARQRFLVVSTVTYPALPRRVDGLRLTQANEVVFDTFAAARP